MERFKILEKEMKIKAYSKEGLNLSTKLTPQEQQKADLIFWIRESLETLNSQIELYEAEIDSIKLPKRKQGKSEENENVLKNLCKIEKHRMHIEKLELCLRLLQNDQIQPSKVADIKDAIDYYISFHNVLFDDFRMIHLLRTTKYILILTL